MHEGQQIQPESPDPLKPLPSSTPTPIAKPHLPVISWLPKEGRWTQSITIRILLTLPVIVALTILAILQNTAPGYTPSINSFVIYGALIGLAVIYVMFYIWALERIFLKAGLKPSLAWVPIYNLAMLYEISGVSPHWVWMEFVPRPQSISRLSGFVGPLKLLLIPLYVISIAFAILRLIIKVYAFGKLAVRFGKPSSYGLVIFATPGILELGFGKSSYGDTPSEAPIDTVSVSPTPKIYQLTWRGFLLFLLLPILYAAIVGLSFGALLTVGVVLLLLIGESLTVLAAYIIPAIAVFFIMRVFFKALAKKFLIMNTDSILMYCFAFVIAYVFLLHSVLIAGSPQDIFRQAGSNLLKDVIVLGIFPFLATIYYLFATQLMQNLRINKSARAILLVAPIVAIVATGIGVTILS